jgi:hypothetical protein
MGTVNNISMGISYFVSPNAWSPYIVPLPPLAEQRAIVFRVDSLMSTLVELQKQITERKSQSEMLMQAVLREALEGERTGYVGVSNGNIP